MEMKARKDKMKMDSNDEELENKEIEIFGTHITVFENGDVYLSTKGDVHIIHSGKVFESEFYGFDIRLK